MDFLEMSDDELDAEFEASLILSPDDVENWDTLPYFIQHEIIRVWEAYFEEEWDGKNQLNATE